jgi:predicted P-loop ATPase
MAADCLKAAIEYATKYGWAVFPVHPQTKRPMTPHGCKDAKKDVGAIKAWWRRWPDAGVGIATGSASNLVVIDEDIDENRGIDGRDSVREWERAHGALPDTVMAITGRGGYHLYFHYTGDDIGNRAGILEGVDVRGEGGYVIAPPSIHPNGTEYQWEYHPEDYELSEVTDTIREFLQPKEREKTGESFHLPERIERGCRNETLYKLACSMQAQGLPDSAIRAAVEESNDALCDEPLDSKEIDLIVRSALTHAKGELKFLKPAEEEWHEPKLACKKDKDGNVTTEPAQTIANAEEAIQYDEKLFNRIGYNVLAYAPYVYGSLPWKEGRGWREWNNTDDSNLRSYIERKYGLKSAEKTMDALNNVCNRRPFNPVRQTLEMCANLWDGNKYIDNLLPTMLGAEATPYTAAVMRVFMLGAISRIYKPGIKFDYMLVLVGAQGIGKSAFLRFLAMSDDWYNDNFNSLDGDRAFEKLRGMWIVEMAELQATKRAKDVESIKAFITSQVDSYRAPYNRRTEARPRMCVLAGTSNPVDFLTDKTGNRRFLPISCGVNTPTVDMFADPIATKSIFIQAWGEAMDEFEQSGRKPKLVLPRDLQQEALNAQAAYQEEDPMIGLIQEWLDSHIEIERVCATMLWREALGHTDYDTIPDHRTVNRLHDIMKNNIAGWEYIGRQKVAKYGVQRCYERKKKQDFVDATAEEALIWAKE